jgi:cell fate regulator YaaT (PSP1 superfamily)
MGCSGCSTGRGCSTVSGGLPGGCRNNGSCGAGGCNKLSVFDWLANMELPGGTQPCDVVEVRFKNSRKEFFRNVNNLALAVGDVIAVEASPGHDIGGVSMAGELVRLQLKKKGTAITAPEIKKVYRKARQNDIDKWREAQSLEEKTMHRARTIAVALGLQMKISDVEYQGDKTKAIFYYTADDRVDFRELIKKYAEEFRVRIEMRQIGARQEASRLGGIGSCGRELCCSTWLTDFRSVSTTAARYQQLSLNPLKLAGQCGKLKCCLNYELDSYLDAIKDFPDVSDVKLKSQKGDAVHQKTDIFRRTMWFSYFDNMSQFIPLPVDRVKEIIEMNKKGEMPTDLGEAVKEKEVKLQRETQPDYENVVGQDSLTRFDNRKKKKKKHNNKNRNRPRPSSPSNSAQPPKPAAK